MGMTQYTNERPRCHCVERSDERVRSDWFVSSLMNFRMMLAQRFVGRQ
jgi:hypothetical protein